MNFAFTALSLVIAAGFLTASLFRTRIANVVSFEKSLVQLVTAVILYFPVSNLFAIGEFVSWFAKPIGFVLAALSLRSLCLALIRP